MKKIIFVSTLVIFLGISLTAQHGNFGIGLILGEPTGLSAKYNLDEKNSIAGGLGWAFLENEDRISLHIDYLYHTLDVIQTPIILKLHYGFGMHFRFREHYHSTLGVRGVLGYNLILEEAPLEFFIELAPVFELLPSTDLSLDGGIGARYYFQI